MNQHQMHNIQEYTIKENDIINIVNEGMNEDYTWRLTTSTQNKVCSQNQMSPQAKNTKTVQPTKTLPPKKQQQKNRTK